MAKTDWAQLNAEYLQEHEATGISAKDWCDSRGLNYNSARRYLKTRGQSPAQPEKSRAAAQSAHSEVRKTAHTAQSAQAKTNEVKGKGGSGRGEKSSSSVHTPVDSDQNPKTNGRDNSGRFIEGNPGNPNPPNQWRPGDRPALTHGGYAKFLDADELFDQAEALKLRDELIFTRARVISVTKTLKALQHDLAEAQELTDRLALYDKILRAEQALDRNIQRIESIERTLSALMVDAVNVPKIEEDTRRIRAATRKLTAEADRLEKDGGSESTPVSEMVTELQGMGTGGLMS
ncbi:terminase [Aeromonas sp. MdU4]|uniref:terminase n=1 Tax=Aeromonas sp. MdU4 TaxID=3342819 RepID=UPI0035B70787